MVKVETNALDVADVGSDEDVLNIPGKLRGSVRRVEVYGLEKGGGGNSSLSNFPDPSNSRGSYVVLSQSPYAWYIWSLMPSGESKSSFIGTFVCCIIDLWR